ncbi:hypothetical protein Q5425_29635 [Amycolatopsis sp. A133]|uniref:hypothetical protein n=1 Tax=Amycolatopsis sp. A133 TaxID=3064472 RepID=UPI0027EA6463|nr:hypothetical protein [Amycolatopsis sp. A133]MDQ7807919.1 hypothetical protein [Amycolatopsis sp. A133]
MGRAGRALTVVLTTACLAACSPSPTAPFTTRLATAFTAPPPPPATTASPAILSAACPFLGTAELQQLLGTSEDIIATEQPPDPAFATGTTFQCRYEGKYVHPWLADLWIISDAATQPAEALEKSKQDCSEPATAIPGAGEAAYFCDRTGPGEAEMVVTAKRNHGRTRLAVAYVVKHRSEVYAGLAKLLGERL